MPKKLAVTFSGAVSLGCYEAGVLFEILDAISQHNQSAATGPADKVFIDVATGASAGGLSVALAAQKLLYEGASLSEPYNNPLYASWVVDTDIDKLLTFADQEPSDQSIFSSNYIDQVASKYLLSRYSVNPVPPPVLHPAINPAMGTIQLGMALSNLNGIDYSLETEIGENFTYTRFQDEFGQTLDASADELTAWQPIKDAAVSCGAFPFAFRAKELSRQKSCYSSPFFDPSGWPDDPHTFTYTDGGVFQNEPLGMAKNFVDNIDNHQGNENRAYLFCAPDPKTSASDQSFSASGANFLNMAKRLVSAVFDEARFQDWIMAEQINKQVQLFDSRALALQKLILAGTLPTESVHAVSVPLLSQFFQLPEKQQDLDAARSQLRGQFSKDFQELRDTKDETSANAWIDAILLFELAANLHEKDLMYIYTATAKSSELAGGALVAFLGFFGENYRQHDYDVGRKKAQDLIQTFGQKGPLPRLNYQPQPIRAIDASLANARIDQIPVEKRKLFRSRLENRANALLKEANLPVLLREPLELFFVNRKISEFVGL